MSAVIPPRRHRRIQRPYDKELYRLRGLVENAFLYLKRWRGIATRYAKNSASFLAAVQIRCIALSKHETGANRTSAVLVTHTQARWNRVP